MESKLFILLHVIALDRTSLKYSEMFFSKFWKNSMKTHLVEIAFIKAAN